MITNSDLYTNIDGKLKLVELLNTYEGEGKHQGQRITLLRFKLCSMKCPFCDTVEKMKEVEKEYDYSYIYNFANTTGHFYMITGGEPTLYKDECINYINYVLEKNKYLKKEPFFSFESNGFKLKILIDELNSVVKQYNPNFYTNCLFYYSPKFLNTDDFKKNIDTCYELSVYPNVYLKILASEEYREMNFEFLKTILSNGFYFKHIYIMPIGDTPEKMKDNFKYAMELCDEFNLSFSSRLHIMHNFK